LFNQFVFRIIREATISFLSFALKYIWFFSAFILSTSLFLSDLMIILKREFYQICKKGFCPKQGKSLKNYAIFRFSCKPRGTISSARKHVFEKSVAKAVEHKDFHIR